MERKAQPAAKTDWKGKIAAGFFILCLLAAVLAWIKWNAKVPAMLLGFGGLVGLLSAAVKEGARWVAILAILADVLGVAVFVDQYYSPPASEKQASRIEEKTDQLLDRLGKMEGLLKPTEQEVKTELEQELSAEMGRKQDEALRLFREAGQDYGHGRLLQAIPKLEQALAIADIPSFHLVLGNALYATSSYKEALGQYQAALDGYRKGQDRRGQANALGNLGLVYLAQGDLARAEQHLQQTQKNHQELGDFQGQVADLVHLGGVYGRQGELSSAHQYFQRALDICREIDFGRGQPPALVGLGLVYLAQGDLARAEQRLKEALDIYQKLDDFQGQANALGNLGIVYKEKGDFAGAEQHHREALKIDQKFGYRWQQAADLGNLGTVYYAQGDRANALQYLEQAAAIFRDIGAARDLATTEGNIALVKQAMARQPVPAGK